MRDTRLRIQFRAKAPDENLTLEDFSNQVSDFYRALSELDQHLSSRKRATVAFHVVDLKHSSPSEITIEAIGLEDSLEDNSSRVVAVFGRTIEELNAGKKVHGLPREVLEPIHRIAKSVSESIKEIKLFWSQSSVFVTSEISKMLAELLEDEKITVGAIRGMLEAINVHKGANSFRIYPIVGPSYITCRFPPALKEKAKAAIEHYVLVSGRFHYWIGCEYPYLIDAEDVEPMPDEAALPTLASLRGIVELKENKSAEELLEEARRGQWE